MNRRLAASGPSPGPGASVSRQGRSRSRVVPSTGGTLSVCLAGPMPDPLPARMPEPPPDAAPDPIPDPTTEISLVNNVPGHRYEAWFGEVLAGFFRSTASTTT